MAKTLSLSLDEFPALSGLLPGQSVELKVAGSVLDATDRMVILGVSSLSVTKRTKLSANEIVQQLAAIREKLPGKESRP